MLIPYALQFVPDSHKFMYITYQWSSEQFTETITAICIAFAQPPDAFMAVTLSWISLAAWWWDGNEE